MNRPDPGDPGPGPSLVDWTILAVGVFFIVALIVGGITGHVVPR